jgi:hypothetical protein
MRHSIQRNILWIATLASLALNLSTTTAAESVFQKMKRAALEQSCRGGDQKSCQDLAKMGQKPSQGQQTAEQSPQTSGAQQPRPQQPGQKAPRSSDRQQAASGQLNDSGPFKPPAGTKIEEKILAPVQESAKFEISPHGVHVATIENDGSRVVVWYDGVEGPRFDEIIEQPFHNQVVFSPDGNRYAYCARSGTQYVVVVDGKELVRSSEANSGRFDGASCELGFTSNSKHVFWMSNVVLETTRGKMFHRFWFDGRPSPTGSVTDGPAISPDGGHLAYGLTISDPYHQDRFAFAVDGKIEPYVAGAPQWTADSKHLYTQRSSPPTGTELLFDGRPIAKAFGFKVYIPPVGDMVVVAVTGGANGHPFSFLVVNGKKVPGSETVERGLIEKVIFSADGKHYAALCLDTTNHHYVFSDGKRGEEYAAINDLAFTGDSSAVAYQAIANGKMFVVIGGHEYGGAGIGALTGPVVASAGSHVGASMTLSGRSTLLLDGKPVPVEARQFGSVGFSPDGKHCAFVAYDGSTGGHLMLDTTRVGESVVDGSQPIDPANPSPAALPYTFSSDSQHIAYLGRMGDTNGIAVDGKFIATPHVANAFLRFSPDSKHLFWLSGGGWGDPGATFRLLADGKPILGFSPAGALSKAPQWWDFNPDGTLSFLVQDDNSLKRITITPSPETSVATMLGGSGTVAANR